MEGLYSESEFESSQHPELDRFQEHDKYLSLLTILKGHEEFTLNNEGVIISSNLEAVNITGYEEYEVIGKHISMFYPPDEQEKVAKDLEKAVKFKQVIIAGPKLKKRNTTFWAKMKIQALEDHGKIPHGFKVILKDGTHRALSNLRVRTIRDEYLTIFNNPFVGTFKFKLSDGQISMWNPKAALIAGIENLNGSCFSDLFADKNEFKRLIDEIREKGKVEEYEFQLGNRSQQAWAIVSCRYFATLDFVEGIIMDITEKKVQLQELEKVNAELDQFIYHASHDLRSPLTTMLGLTNLIQIDKSEDTVDKYNQMLRERILHLDCLLHELVSVTYNNKAQLQCDRIYFEDELKSVLQEFAITTPDMKVHFFVEPGPEFYSDSVRLRAILRNLVSNAIKYYNKNRKNPFLKVTVSTTEHHAVLNVKDNGVGIDPIFQPRIFDMFFRADNEVKGSGLGLYIVKSMVTKLGGTIQVKSAKGKGSSFTLTLPNQKTSPK
jgi:PAS domain S-box-containing protein